MVHVAIARILLIINKYGYALTRAFDTTGGVEDNNGDDCSFLPSECDLLFDDSVDDAKLALNSPLVLPASARVLLMLSSRDCASELDLVVDFLVSELDIL